MDGLVVILIIIVAVVSTISKGKKIDKNRPGQQRPAGQARPGQAARRTASPAEVLPRAQGKPTAPATEARKPAVPATPQPAAPATPAQPPVMQQIRELLAELVDENEVHEPEQPKAARPAFAEGESFMDDKDCVGGSLPHEETGLHEGESGMYTTPGRAREASEDTVAAVVRPGRIDAAALRQAVVMSEILGRPKALKMRGAGR